MTTLTSPSSETPNDDNDATQLFQQQHQRHISDDGQPKMEYSAYGTSQQVMQSYNPDLSDVSVSQTSQGYSTAKEEPMYSSQTDADVTGASTSASMATLADYNQVWNFNSLYC
jgi:hypothetical protein